MIAGGQIYFKVNADVFAELVAHVQRDIVFKWTRSIALLLLVVFWERRPLDSIGIRRIASADAVAALGGYLLVFLLSRVLVLVLPRIAPESLQIAITLFPFSLRLAMAVTAAVTEEVESRGYLIERLESVTGSSVVAGGLAFLVFVIEHLNSWDTVHALRITPWAVVLVILYLWRRNLPACIMLHLLVDAVALLVLPRLH